MTKLIQIIRSNFNSLDLLMKIGVAVFSVLMFTAPAIYNGYPLVYSDSGAYLLSSVELLAPIDRPLFYGFFLRITGMQANNWISILVQGYISYIVLLETVKILFKQYAYLYTLIFSFILCSITGVAWYVSQIMPDFFSAISVLLVFILIYKPIKSIGFTFFGLLFFLSVGTHLSNFLIVGTVLFILAIFQIKPILRNHESLFYKYLIVGSITLLTILSHCIINYKQRDRFNISNASNIFLVAKLTESPILKTYMRDNPNHIEIPFIDEIDSFPNNSAEFLWWANSPLYTSGLSWPEINDKYDPVIHDFFSIPKYRNWYIAEFFRSGWTQVQFHKVGSGLSSYREGSSPEYSIAQEFSSELPAYRKSVQYTHDLGSNYHDQISAIVFYVSWIIVFLGIPLILILKLNKKIRTLFIVCVVGVVSNAYITAGLANVYDRLQVRVLWLITFLALIILIEVYKAFQERRTTKKRIQLNNTGYK